MSNKQYKCKYCDKILSSQGSLSNHINKSKKCISQRVKTKCETNKIFSCKFCPKTYTTKYNLEKHISKNHQTIILKNKYENKIKILKEEHKKQKEEYKTKQLIKRSIIWKNYITF